jgi:hypothetical protein
MIQVYLSCLSIFFGCRSSFGRWLIILSLLVDRRLVLQALLQRHKTTHFYSRLKTMSDVCMCLSALTLTEAIRCLSLN